MRRVVLALLPLLAACGNNASDQPSPGPMSLPVQAITYQDIEANNLYGTACNYASGKSMGAIVIAENDGAAMKIGGKILRFKLDPQCKKLRFDTGSRYLAPGYVLDLTVEGEERQTGYETVNFERGTVKLSDEQGRVLYSTGGQVQCGS